MTSSTRPECCPTHALMPRDPTVALAETLAALGDPTRLQLAMFVHQCAPSPVCACSFPEVFNLSRSTISHHLTRLVQAEVLERNKQGRWSCYTVNPGFDREILEVISKQVETPKQAVKEPHDKPTAVMFACTQNAGRSQMAAAIAASLAGPSVRVLSAGTNPASEVHPNVAVALREVGLEPSSKPAKLDPADVKESDWVITMGCGETCPIFPGVHYEDWAIEDPADKPLEEVRKIRDTIRVRVEDFLGRLEAFR